VPDEEDGSAGGSAWLTDQGALVDRGAIGMLTPEPTSGVVWNACRGAITQRVTVHGRESHVGLLHAGDNAFERMVDVVQELRRLRDEVAERRTGYAIEPPEARRSVLLLGGIASSGAGFNVVPARASFTLDRRPNPEEDLDAERARLTAVVDRFRADGYRIDVETLQDTFAAGCPDDDPLAVALADGVEATEGARPAFELCPGVLEIRWYAREGVPAYAYGPGRLEVAHGADEHVDIPALTRCAAVYARTIERLLATSSS
jgi:succinyl-diaminopimelate desuccinylase